MIQRTVLLKFAETTTQEQLLEVAKRFKALKDLVPGLDDVQAGLNLAEKSKEFQVVLLVRFENQAALDAYAVNADHQSVVTYIREVGRLDSIGVDIEV